MIHRIYILIILAIISYPESAFADSSVGEARKDSLPGDSAAIILGEVVVTATRTSKSLKNVPVITRALKKSHLRTDA